MTRIVAGKFGSIGDVDVARRTLLRAGFRDDEIQSFFVGPPRRHDPYALGGDAHHDEGTKKSGRSALLGISIGAGVGLAIGAIGSALVPELRFSMWAAGVAIGAYMGALLGALQAARAGREDRASIDEPVEQPGGMLLAVNAQRPFGAAMAIATLRRHGARDIAQTRGEWKDGGWQDFDPRVPLPRVKMERLRTAPLSR